MKKSLLSLLIVFSVSVSSLCLSAESALTSDARLNAMRAEAQALVLVQSVLSWYVRTQGEESIFEQTYKGHEGLFTKENILYIDNFLKQHGGKLTDDEKLSLKFFRDYLVGEYIGLDTAHFDDEINNAEANARVKIDWIEGEIAYRDLSGLLDNEKDPDKRKAIQAAIASVWEKTLNPIHERLEQRQQELSKEVGYPNYVALSEEVRMVSLKDLIKFSQDYI
ncbi:MAG: hypothetical protein AB1546_00315, partial [bacterium]